MGNKPKVSAKHLSLMIISLCVIICEPDGGTELIRSTDKNKQTNNSAYRKILNPSTEWKLKTIYQNVMYTMMWS